MVTSTVLCGSDAWGLNTITLFFSVYLPRIFSFGTHSETLILTYLVFLLIGLPNWFTSHRHSIPLVVEVASLPPVTQPVSNIYLHHVSFSKRLTSDT